MPFVVPVSAIQRPGSVCLVEPDPGDVGLGPDGLILPIGSLLEECDGHSVGDVSDADLVLSVRRDQIQDVAVEVGLGFSPDVVWNGHGQFLVWR